MHLVDMRLGRSHAQHLDGTISDTAFVPKTIQAMRHCLAKGEQVLVFLNRRGYAPILICRSCGHQANCPNCDAHLTVHKKAYSPCMVNYAAITAAIVRPYR